MNKVILMGRLTRDVEMRQTPNGVSLARFSIVVNRRFAGKDAQQQADFINCVAWRQTGEFIAKYFRKGSMIAVAGSIQTRYWDGQDGKRQYATEVVVDEAYFTGEKSDTGGQNTSQYSGYPSAPAAQTQQYKQERVQEPTNDFQSIDYNEDELPF